MKNVMCSLVCLGFIALAAPPSEASPSAGAQKKELLVVSTAEVPQVIQCELTFPIEGREACLALTSVAKFSLVESESCHGSALLRINTTARLALLTSTLVTGPLGPDNPQVVSNEANMNSDLKVGLMSNR